MRSRNQTGVGENVACRAAGTG
ncbi:hypothetical protein E2C01_055582 [Portunus trituberculatus]|uniref:Uncharacterized protein n=1 Tax=Portunus trituberculatus TaxID=210409 RepID=A0A5B7GVE5_PORTR|nr:hypothetical protein [Portunus trituberculatus]